MSSVAFVRSLVLTATVFAAAQIAPLATASAQTAAAPQPAAAVAAAPAASAAAQPAPAPVGPQAKASRDLVRRMLLDACIYQEWAKDDMSDEEKEAKPEVANARREKVLDACQCASGRAIKPIKDEDIVAVDASRKVPDAWYAATTDAFPGCRR